MNIARARPGTDREQAAPGAGRKSFPFPFREFDKFTQTVRIPSAARAVAGRPAARPAGARRPILHPVQAGRPGGDGLFGGEGPDWLCGGAGDDTLSGGTDTLAIRNSGLLPILLTDAGFLF
ncbi:MAG: hypothetical protein KI788_01950 [Mameliella sp.]|nr:hypothetical protein [Mameliella sp.]